MAIWSLWKQARSGQYTPRGAAADAQCVIGFSFGGIAEGLTVRPGPSNEDLARFGLEHFPELPRIYQAEIADAHLALAPAGMLFRIDHHRQPGAYLDTREVARQAREVVQTHGWRTAAVLAHAHHVPRAAAVCARLGIAIVVPPGLGAIRFCPESHQEWTRDVRGWSRRELRAIVYYRCRGWV